MSKIFGRLSFVAVGLGAALLIAPPAMADDTPARVDTSWNNEQPNYPDDAQLRGEQGWVNVFVLVNSRGNPRKVRVEQSSGFPDLDLAAATAVMNWKFIPATSDGDHVSRWTSVRVVFKLPEATSNKPASY